jgi:hypothetical protein
VARKKTPREEDQRDDLESSALDAFEVINGVTVNWLCKVFGGHRDTVSKKLIACPVIGKGKGGAKLYHLPTAAAFLSPPATRDIEAYLRNGGALPADMDKDYWDAKLKRQTWEERAGELWKTPDVMNAFVETFKLVRDSLLMVPDSVELVDGLSDKQRTTLTHALDGLQRDLQNKFLDLSKDPELFDEKPIPEIANIDDEL